MSLQNFLRGLGQSAALWRVLMSSPFRYRGQKNLRQEVSINANLISISCEYIYYLLSSARTESLLERFWPSFFSPFLSTFLVFKPKTLWPKIWPKSYQIRKIPLISIFWALHQRYLIAT